MFVDGWKIGSTGASLGSRCGFRSGNVNGLRRSFLSIRTLVTSFVPSLRADIVRTFPLLRSLKEVSVWRGGMQPITLSTAFAWPHWGASALSAISVGVPHRISGHLERC